MILICRFDNLVDAIMHAYNLTTIWARSSANVISAPLSDYPVTLKRDGLSSQVAVRTNMILIHIQDTYMQSFSTVVTDRKASMILRYDTRMQPHSRDLPQLLCTVVWPCTSNKSSTSQSKNSLLTYHNIFGSFYPLQIGIPWVVHIFKTFEVWYVHNHRTKYQKSYEISWPMYQKYQRVTTITNSSTPMWYAQTCVN